MVSMAVWAFLLLLGVVLLLGHGLRAWLAAGLMLFVGVYLGSTATGEFVRTMLAGLFGLMR